MRARKNPLKENEFVEDTDAALRSLSRRFPEAMAQLVLRPGERLESAEWLETQVSLRPLRMDRLLHVRVEGGQSRLVHGEWTDRLTSDVKRRMGEYHLSAALAERLDAEATEKVGGRKRKGRPVESIVVVLRGRKKPWPKTSTYRTTPNDTKFGGAWFNVEAVYQKSVAELEAMGSPFWLAFVPLAHDVDEEKLRRIIEELRKKVVRDDFDELIATMLSTARLKNESQFLSDVIRSAAAKEMPMHPFMRDGLEQGMAKGMEKGMEKGIQEGMEKGIQKGIQQGIQRALAPFVRIFELRLERPLTPAERTRLAKRINNDDPALLGDAVVNLSPDELVAWLAPRKSSKRTRSSSSVEATPVRRSSARKTAKPRKSRRLRDFDDVMVLLILTPPGDDTADEPIEEPAGN